jgi:hypothetical protein
MLWRLAGPSARIAYERRATLLPSPDFGGRSGYVVLGDPRHGFFTLSQLGTGSTPHTTGGCDTAAPIRVVRVDPANGTQSYVATLPAKLVQPLDCHLSRFEVAVANNSLYPLVDTVRPGVHGRVLRMPL